VAALGRPIGELDSCLERHFAGGGNFKQNKNLRQKFKQAIQKLNILFLLRTKFIMTLPPLI